MLQPRGASAPEVAEKLVVLVVEENAGFRSANAERLRAAGFEVLEAANSAMGCTLATKSQLLCIG